MKQLLLTAQAIHAGPLILVNRQYPYRESGETALVPVGETPERMERRAAALLSMLNSCASGVSVVNIDNGFGAAYQASLINHLSVGTPRAR